MLCLLVLSLDRRGISETNIPNTSPSSAAELFPQGKVVTIREPYMKVGADGMAFVRVDDLSDLRVDVALPAGTPLPSAA